MTIKVDTLPEGFGEYHNVYNEDKWLSQSGAYTVRKWLLNYNRAYGLKDSDVVIFFRDGYWRIGIKKKDVLDDYTI